MPTDLKDQLAEMASTFGASPPGMDIQPPAETVTPPPGVTDQAAAENPTPPASGAVDDEGGEGPSGKPDARDTAPETPEDPEVAFLRHLTETEGEAAADAYIKFRESQLTPKSPETPPVEAKVEEARPDLTPEETAVAQANMQALQISNTVERGYQDAMTRAQAVNVKVQRLGATLKQMAEEGRNDTPEYAVLYESFQEQNAELQQIGKDIAVKENDRRFLQNIDRIVGTYKPFLRHRNEYAALVYFGRIDPSTMTIAAQESILNDALKQLGKAPATVTMPAKKERPGQSKVDALKKLRVAMGGGVGSGDARRTNQIAGAKKGALHADPVVAEYLSMVR